MVITQNTDLFSLLIVKKTLGETAPLFACSFDDQLSQNLPFCYFGHIFNLCVPQGVSHLSKFNLKLFHNEWKSVVGYGPY